MIRSDGSHNPHKVTTAKDLTFMDGESRSLMVELFSSTTIMAYSTSSPLCSKQKYRKYYIRSGTRNFAAFKTTSTKLALIKRVVRMFLLYVSNQVLQGCFISILVLKHNKNVCLLLLKASVYFITQLRSRPKQNFQNLDVRFNSSHTKYRNTESLILQNLQVI